jgi:hypothetical protein
VLFRSILRKIRDWFRALIAKFGAQPSPIWRKIADTIKKINSAVREVIDFYEEEIKPVLDSIILVAKYIRTLIDYIASLPDRLAKFVQACLKEFIESIAAELQEAARPDSPSPFADIIREANSFAETAEDALDVAAEITAFPAEVVDAFVNPSSDEDVERVSEQVDSFFAQNIPTAEQSVEQNSFSGSKAP